MTNMSYCRFRNTATDFLDCYTALERIAADEEQPLSNDELEAAKLLAVMAHDFLSALSQVFEISMDDLDEEKLKAAMQALNDTARDVAGRPERLS